MELIDLFYKLIENNAFWVVISSIFTSFFGYLFTNRLQNNKAKQDTRKFLLEKKLDIYTQAFENLRDVKTSQEYCNSAIVCLIPVELYCDEETLKEIKDFGKILQSIIEKNLRKETFSEEEQKQLLESIMQQYSNIEFSMRADIQKEYFNYKLV